MKSCLPEYVESISVMDFYDSFAERLLLRLVTSRKTLSRSTIRERSLNRPALAVTGYFKYFANKRIQLFGAGEMAFFREQSAARRKAVIEAMVAKKIPCVVVSRSLAPTSEMIEISQTSLINELNVSRLSYLLTFTASDIMTKNPFVVYPDDVVYTAAILMIRHDISGIPVIKNKKLVGIITKSDIVNVLAEI